MSDAPGDFKTYEYQGEQFKVSKPEACAITVTGKGLSGQLHINQSTGLFRATLYRQGSDHPTLEAALINLCRRILNRAKEPPQEKLCESLGAFYTSLE